MRLRTGLFTVVALIALVSTARAATPEAFLYGHSKDGANLPFRYFVPPGYDAAQAYPLILFLHGSGERGNDNTAQLNNHANGAMYLLDDANLALQPVFMIAPQCPTEGWWSGGTLISAIGIIDQIAANYHIDPDRIYITGLSMGGMGTWSAVTTQPGRFAAAVPMSGNANGSTVPAAVASAVPFWFFHAANDGTVNVSGSDDLVNALRNAGANTIYTRYAAGNHGIWPVAYRHPLVFRWLVAQRRGNPGLVAPLAHIMQPTEASDWSTEDAQIDLAGSADNGVDPIDGVTWDHHGGAGGDAIGSSAWSVAGVPLEEGANLLRVTATGPSEHAAYGGHITFNDSLRVTRTGPPPAPGTVVAAINSGGAAYVAADGTAYAADYAFDGGSTQVSDTAVDATDDDTLYNAWRWGNFAYHLALPAGPYRVDLQFADTYNSVAGQRVCDVPIQGATVLNDFDIIASVGVDTATVRTINVDVSYGMLDIAFANGSAGNARIDALRVIRADGDPLFANGFDT